MTVRHIAVLTMLAAVALAVNGCGGGTAAGPNPPPPGPIPDVNISGTVTTGANQITGMDLNLTDAGDSLDVAADAEATVSCSASPNRITVPFSVIGNGSGLHFGQIPLCPGMNIIELKAKSGHVIVFADGRAHTVLFIGRLEVGIEMLDDGTIIAPTQFELKVPTDDPRCEPPPPPSGDPERQAIFRGLAPDDWCRGRVRDRFGGESVRNCQANDHGVAVVNDYRGGVTAHNLSGPNSLVGFYFAQHYDLLP